MASEGNIESDSSEKKTGSDSDNWRQRINGSDVRSRTREFASNHKYPLEKPINEDCAVGENAYWTGSWRRRGNLHGTHSVSAKNEDVEPSGVNKEWRGFQNSQSLGAEDGLRRKIASRRESMTDKDPNWRSATRPRNDERETEVNHDGGNNATHWRLSRGYSRTSGSSAHREGVTMGMTIGESRKISSFKSPKAKADEGLKWKQDTARGCSYGKSRYHVERTAVSASRSNNCTSRGISSYKRAAHPIDSRNLEQFNLKDPSETAVLLSTLKTNFEVSVNEESLSDDRQRLLWKSLSHICDHVGADHTVTRLLDVVTRSKLLKTHLPRTLLAIKTSVSGTTANTRTFLKNILKVLETILQSLPSRMSDIKVAVTLLSDAITELKNLDITFREEMGAALNSLGIHMTAIEKEKERKLQVYRISKNPPPDDFRLQSILPTMKELQEGYEPFLRPNVIRGVYADVEHYLDVQFRLLKEDFLYPLRNGIAEYLALKKKHPDRTVKPKDVRIYDDVKMVSTIRNKSGITQLISFKKQNHVDWNSSKKLQSGSLLILSQDNFKSCIFATVANRDVKNLRNGIVIISLINDHDLFSISKSNFVMAESLVLYEAYRPVLQGLQSVSARNFPLSRYLLGLQNSVEPPSYLHDNSLDRELISMNISPFLKKDVLRSSATIPLLQDNAWQMENVLPDQSQLQAGKNSLTSELSIIQGPPGTGKTYVGLKIMETLLLNRNVWSEEGNTSPILVVCFTNHALDQFLEGILKFQANGIVRVGSRSQSEQLQQYNLDDIIKNRSNFDESYIRQRIFEIHKDVEQAVVRLGRLQDQVAGAERGIVDEYELQSFISLQHFQSLHRPSQLMDSESWIMEWLLTERENDSDWKQLNSKTQTTTYRIGGEGGVTHNIQDNNVQEERRENAPSQNDENRAHFASERTDMQPDNQNDDQVDDEGDSCLVLDINELNKRDERNLKEYIQNKVTKKEQIDPAMIPQITDVWQLQPNVRWALYHYWVAKYERALKARLTACEEKCKHLRSELNEAYDLKRYHVLREAAVIGMTTTGAARNQPVLQRVKPKIVLIEEAAEVLEAHVITALNVSCQQLILIGDHQQLSPKPNVYMLAKRYHLDVSLLERMINNGFPYTQLEQQYRMRPEISNILKKHFYKHLRDDDSVRMYDNIRGMEKNVFFLDHQEPEHGTADTKGYFNSHEHDVLVSLCFYLLQQGYKPTQITILTAYVGQLLHLKHLIHGDDRFTGVKVSSFDNYQGEENDIILESFVRSNNEGNIGFLQTPNRVCVALSRARKGLFCIGNFSMYAENSVLWKNICEDLESKDCMGEFLPLQCINHDQKNKVKTSKDFDLFKQGGCTEPCDARLNCGHVCRLMCHPTDANHVSYKCQRPCKKVICESGHRCPMRCSEPCPTECKTLEEKTLSCSHTLVLPCHEDTTGLEKECRVIVTRVLSCGHSKTETCREHGQCHVIVQKTLGCSHTCSEECHKDPRNIICHEIVEKSLGCSHKCFEECHKDNNDVMCQEKIHTSLPCGHQLSIPCYKRNASVVCNVLTEKILACGHSVVEECSQNTKCVQIVTKILHCGHTLSMKCSEDILSGECTATCSKILACGHTCKATCGKPCIEQCEEEVTRSDWSCGHAVKVRCCDEPDSCHTPCKSTLICGHRCQGTCGKCSMGRYHVPCAAICNKKLICGHLCPLPCGTPCLPCRKICQRRCRHTQCSHSCDIPCDVCTKRCDWKCAHHQCTMLCCEPCNRSPCEEPCPNTRECGHSCIGLCGEICPNKCWVCDKDELDLMVLEAKDKENLRFIQLEDCGHIFEVGALDRHLGFGTSPSETFTKLSMKCCPRCKTEINVSRRYGNLLKEWSLQYRKVLHHFERHQRKLIEDKDDFITKARQSLEKCCSNEMITKCEQLLQLNTPNSIWPLQHRFEVMTEVALVYSDVMHKRSQKKYRPMSHVKVILETIQKLVSQICSNVIGEPIHLTNQQLLDLWKEVRRLTILSELYYLFAADDRHTKNSQVRNMLSILLSDSHISADDLEALEKLRDTLYTSNIPNFQLRGRFSFHVDAWQLCENGHVSFGNPRGANICSTCVQHLETDAESADEGQTTGADGEDDPTGKEGDESVDEQIREEKEQQSRLKRRQKRKKRRKSRREKGYRKFVSNS